VVSQPKNLSKKNERIIIIIIIIIIIAIMIMIMIITIIIILQVYSAGLNNFIVIAVAIKFIVNCDYYILWCH